jgi:hypothetical protein
MKPLLRASIFTAICYAMTMCCAVARASTPKHHHAAVSTRSKSTHTATHTHRAATEHGRKATATHGRASHAAAKHEVYSHIAAMDADRATAIQTALIKRGYLTGTPSGHWDAQSVAAMQKLQSDSGWQSKVVPDSRALIKLGLGPGSPTTVTPTPPASVSATPAAEITPAGAPKPAAANQPGPSAPARPKS